MPGLFPTLARAWDRIGSVRLTTEGKIPPAGDIWTTDDGRLLVGDGVTPLSGLSRLATLADLQSSGGAVTSVAGRVGAILLTKTDVGLGNVSNTADADKPISTLVASALASKADLVNGLIPSSQIPSLALTTTVTVASRTAMLALTSTQVQPGDLAVDTSSTSTRGSYMLVGTNPGVIGSWVALAAPLDAVQTVNGQSGTVVLGKADVGLGSVDNTADVDKPVSTAQQTALDGKASASGKAARAQSGSQTNANQGSNTQVVLTTFGLNDDSVQYSLSNGNVIVAKAGLYLLTYSGNVSCAATFSLFVQVAGVTVQEGAGPSGQTFTAATIVRIPAGAAVSLRIYGNAAAIVNAGALISFAYLGA